MSTQLIDNMSTKTRTMLKVPALLAVAGLLLGMKPINWDAIMKARDNTQARQMARFLPAKKLNTEQQAQPNIQTGSKEVKQALLKVSKETGTPFDLLVKIAMKESTMNPMAWNKTTNACGLMQITPKTQLELIHQHADELPTKYKSMAKQIVTLKREKLNNGKYWIHYVFAKGHNVKSLKPFCQSAYISAFLGEKLLNRSLERLEGKIVHYRKKYQVQDIRPLTYTDAYLVHMLGVTPAAKFIALNDNSTYKNFKANEYLSREAKANPAIFYARSKGLRVARSINTVYSNIEQKIGTKVLPNHLYGSNTDNVIQLASAR